MARKTAWTPLKKGGSYFRTHVLVAASRQQLEFRASRELMLFAGASLLIGLTVLWLGLDQSG